MEQIVQNSPNQGLFDLQINNEGAEYLREGSKWAKFIAVIGFIFVGFMVIFALFAGSIIAAAMATRGVNNIGGEYLTIIYLVFAVLWFFPCFYLFRFANSMQVALRNNDNEKLLSSLRNLKSHFKFIGILLIVTLTIYVLAIIGLFIFVATAGSLN